MARSVRTTFERGREALRALESLKDEPEGGWVLRWTLRQAIKGRTPDRGVASKFFGDRTPTKARPKRKPRGPELQIAFGKLAPTSTETLVSKKESKRERRAAIREKVFARAAEGQPNDIPRCEGPTNADPRNQGRCVKTATELQHVFGRGKGREPESERNCLAACHDCHLAETRNQPSGAAWWTYFADFFHEKGFFREESKARSRAFLEATRAALPAAPRLNR